VSPSWFVKPVYTILDNESSILHLGRVVLQFVQVVVQPPRVSTSTLADPHRHLVLNSPPQPFADSHHHTNRRQALTTPKPRHRRIRQTNQLADFIVSHANTFPTKIATAVTTAVTDASNPKQPKYAAAVARGRSYVSLFLFMFPSLMTIFYNRCHLGLPGTLDPRTPHLAYEFLELCLQPFPTSTAEPASRG